jgi:hypothetical protein
VSGESDVDPERVFQHFRVIVDGFESGRIQPAESSRLAAQTLKGVETTFRSLVTIPVRAGRA